MQNLNLFDKEFSPLAIINLNALKNNAKNFKNFLTCKLCAVVKSDAYGHGIIECAKEIESFCDYFAVASLSEGIKLRLVGINTPVLCLLPVKNIFRAAIENIEFTVHSVKYFNDVCDFCKQAGIKANVHIAVNSGMNRLGINCLNQLEKMLEQSGEWVKIKGVFSHLYSAEDYSSSKKQLEFFKPFALLAKQKNKDIIAHVCSTNGVFLGEEFWLDMARVGIGIYGYSTINPPFKLEKCMKVVAESIQKRKVKKEENLLYGNYKLKTDERINLCAYGYANGMREIVNAKNRACMNISAFSGNKKYCVIMSDANKTAIKNRTIAYNVLTAFGLNCKRIYYNGDYYESYFG